MTLLNTVHIRKHSGHTASVKSLNFCLIQNKRSLHTSHWFCTTGYIVPNFEVALTQAHTEYSCWCSHTAFRFQTDTTKFPTKSFYTLTCPKTNEDDNAPCSLPAARNISGICPLDWTVTRFVAPTVRPFVTKRAVMAETLINNIRHEDLTVIKR